MSGGSAGSAPPMRRPESGGGRELPGTAGVAASAAPSTRRASPAGRRQVGASGRPGRGPAAGKWRAGRRRAGPPEGAERASERDPGQVQVGLGRFRPSGDGASGFRAARLRALELARLGAPGATCREPERGCRGSGRADAPTAAGPRGSTPSVPPEPGCSRLETDRPPGAVGGGRA